MTRLWKRFRLVIGSSRLSRNCPRMSHRSTPASGLASSSAVVMERGGFATAMVNPRPVPPVSIVALYCTTELVVDYTAHTVLSPPRQFRPQRLVVPQHLRPVVRGAR